MQFRMFLAFSVLVLSGCVERWLLVRTDPPGARVFLDGRDAGQAPARIPFQHYGTRELLLRLPGHESHSQMVEVSAPWYEWFPIDLLAEHAWPWTLEDEHVVDAVLRPTDEERLRAELIELGKGAPPAPSPQEPPGNDAGEGRRAP
ncbi:MAG: PEGA domain-containing protein [Planctomycetes bacterium]|nr:PEGA domain-containing protein [Planctomycetota bacterium]